MNTKLERVFTLLSILLFATALHAGDFTISKFGGVEDFPGEPDEFIQAEFAENLKKVSPGKIRDGMFYSRQKFEDPFEDIVTYELYEGKATDRLGELAKFKSSASYSTLIKAKFYINKGAAFDEDLEIVYFDGKFVYVEGEENLFAKLGGKMTALTISDERPAFLELSSSPSGAEIWVKGKKVGSTPGKFSVIGSKPIPVTLRKKGHYPLTIVMKPSFDKVVQDGVLLIESKELDSPAKSIKLRLLKLESSKDVAALEALEEELLEIITEWPGVSRSTINEIKTAYPPNPNKGASETAEQFEERQGLWQRDYDATLNKLEQDRKLFSAELDKALIRIRSLLESSRYSLKYIAYPAELIKLGRYRGKAFQFTAAVENDLFSFDVKGKVKIGKRSKGDFKDARDEIQLVIAYWNLPAQDGPKYAAVHEISIFLEEEELKFAGKVKIKPGPDCDKGILATGKKFDSKWKRAKHSSEEKATEFDKKIEALNGGSPEPVVTLPPEPEPVQEAIVEDDEMIEETAYSDQDEAIDDALSDMENEDRFATDWDDFQLWTAYALTGISLVSGAVAYLQHMEFSDAEKAYTNTLSAIDDKLVEYDNQIFKWVGDGTIQPAAQGSSNAPISNGSEGSEADPIAAGLQASDADYRYGVQAQIEADTTNSGPYSLLLEMRDGNQATMNSYKSARNLWASIFMVTGAAGITLFTIKF